MPYARCSSHRAREKLFVALGRKPPGYYTMQLLNHQGIYPIEESETLSARSIKGVTILRHPERYNLMKCWGVGA